MVRASTLPDGVTAPIDSGFSIQERMNAHLVVEAETASSARTGGFAFRSSFQAFGRRAAAWLRTRLTHCELVTVSVKRAEARVKVADSWPIPARPAAEEVLDLGEESRRIPAGCPSTTASRTRPAARAGVLVRFCGVSTTTWTYMSPVCLERSTGMPLPVQPEAAAGLGAAGNLHPRLAAVDRRHLELAAERRRHHRDRHAAMQVGAVALEELVRRRATGKYRDRPAARRARRPRPRRRAGCGCRPRRRRNVDRQRALARDAARAGAGRARILDHLAAALAGRTGALEREEALRVADAAGAAAGARRSSAWCRPWRRSRSRLRR